MLSKSVRILKLLSSLSLLRSLRSTLDSISQHMAFRKSLDLRSGVTSLLWANRRRLKRKKIYSVSCKKRLNNLSHITVDRKDMTRTEFQSSSIQALTTITASTTISLLFKLPNKKLQTILSLFNNRFISNHKYNPQLHINHPSSLICKWL